MVPAAVREFFLLERAERTVVAIPAQQRAAMLVLTDAAERRLAAAPSLAEPRTAVAAVALLRDAVGLLALAAAAARDSRDTGDVACPARAADALRPAFAADTGAPAGWERALATLAPTDPLALDRLPSAELRSLGVALEETAAWLRARIETRSTTNLRGARRGRIAALAVLALYVVFAGGARIHRIFRPNLALHQSVTVSSAWPGSIPSSALVDGEHAGLVGPEAPNSDIVHTNREASPSAVIDLGAVRPLHEVRVYNRMDHNFDDGLPYVVDLSANGRDFETAGRRTTHFGGSRFDPPWSLDVSGKSARYVRIRCEQFLALSEVEVY